MGDHPGGLRRSIFTRLLAVSVAMAVSVPLLVGGTFVLVLRPALDRALGGLLDAYSELLAASEPDLEAARQAARRLDLSVRYQGPRGAWATDDSSPTLSMVEQRLQPPPGGEGPARCGPDCRVVLRPDGGAYLVDWHLYDRAQAVHDWMAVVLVLVILGLVAAAHEVIRRALSPIRALRRGVASVAAGDLEVELPRQRPDELGALADGFNEMVGRVREMVRSRDQLLRDVSHELRSPLTRMRVALALGEDGEPRRRLERTVAEMEALVSELLELERLRAGRGVELGPHDLVEVVRDAVLAFADRPPGVALGALPASRTVRLDPDRIRSVLNNLLENALRHALPDSGPVRVSVEERGATVVVRVEDDGPGIPEEDLPRLFEPFFRVDRSRSRGTGGYGLGLALCRRIMEAHGGTIEARNRPGRGAELVLSLPGSP